MHSASHLARDMSRVLNGPSPIRAASERIGSGERSLRDIIARPTRRFQAPLMYRGRSSGSSPGTNGPARLSLETELPPRGAERAR